MRNAFTLIEMLVSLTSATVLMAGLGTCVMIATTHQSDLIRESAGNGGSRQVIAAIDVIAREVIEAKRIHQPSVGVIEIDVRAADQFLTVHQNEYRWNTEASGTDGWLVQHHDGSNTRLIDRCGPIQLRRIDRPHATSVLLISVVDSAGQSHHRTACPINVDAWDGPR